MAELLPFRRSLSPSEKRLLSLRIFDLEARRAGSGRVLTMGATIVVALWLTTLLAADAPSLVVTGFWTLVGAGLTVWILRDGRRERQYINGLLDACHSAQRANQADVYDVKARAFVEFEEVEDEGACLAFALTDGQVVFMVGQQFYEAAKFPSLDFGLVHVLDDKGRLVDEHLEKRGEKAAPVRVIPAARKRSLMVPEHLTIMNVSLDQLESALETDQS